MTRLGRASALRGVLAGDVEYVFGLSRKPHKVPPRSSKLSSHWSRASSAI